MVVRIIFVWILSQLAIIAGLIFPTTAIMMIYFCKLLWLPIRNFLKLEKSDDLEFVPCFNSEYLNCIAGITIILWFPILCCYVYYKEGTIIFLN